MSTHQVSKPRAANQSMAEGLPGTCRSKSGVDASDEPCTKRMVPRALTGARFSHRNRRLAPFPVQCAVPADLLVSSCMRFISPSLAFAALGMLPLASLADEPAKVTFSDAEIRLILSHGPWPRPATTDPTNRASG